MYYARCGSRVAAPSMPSPMYAQRGSCGASSDVRVAAPAAPFPICARYGSCSDFPDVRALRLQRRLIQFARVAAPAAPPPMCAHSGSHSASSGVTPLCEVKEIYMSLVISVKVSHWLYLLRRSSIFCFTFFRCINRQGKSRTLFTSPIINNLYQVSTFRLEVVFVEN